MWRALPFLLLVALGCGPSRRDVRGSWTGTVMADEQLVEQVYQDAKKAGKKELQREQIAAMFQSWVATVTFSDDTTYIMTVGPDNYQGTWTIKENEVFMMVSTVNGGGESYGFGAFDDSESKASARSRSAWVFKLSSNKKQLVGSSPVFVGIIVTFDRH